MADPLRATDPRLIGRYRILRRLGQGGMGTVYLAEDPWTERLVAVKVIRPEYAHEDHFRARFRSEVDRARQVPPFCTAEVLDADPDHETPYLVVEYVDGPSLNEVVTENGPLTGGSLHGVVVGVATALAAIHGAGVIHRDLKPRNVLFALGTPKVIDFGIARPLEPTSFHTRAEEVVGTLAYMAPERLDPETDRLLTPAADVFAWGAVVTYAGTGRTPFAGDSPAVTAARILTQPPRIGDLPPYLGELVIAALEKDPANRPTAPELLDRLLVPGAASAPPLPAELRREAEAAKRSGGSGAAGRRPRRRWVTAVVAAAAVTAAASIGGVMLRERDAVPPPAATPAVVTGPTLFDSLRTESSILKASSDTGSCAYKNGLRVNAKAEASMACGSFMDTVFPPSQSVDVTATLANARSCAAIWFRAKDNGEEETEIIHSYRASVCAAEVRLESIIDGGATVVSRFPTATSIGAPHRIRLVADDREAVLSVDGTPAVRGLLTESSLVSGQVLVGTVAEAGGRGTVTFTDAQFRSGTTADVPAVPEFVTGDADLVAGMWLLEQGRTAIVEPTEYLSGAAYCRRFAEVNTSPKCAQKFVPVPSGMQVSVPVAASPTYLDYRHEPAKCRDPQTLAGTCEVPVGDFRIMYDEPTPWPALLTIRGGKVTAIAHLDIRY
ncbi:serine/threonine protein kinase [Actinoplanes lutulentus]|uniref:Serine/threonine protein kinase n=1 Tax=Actinoplanes lutulentus TaxID=1287878 RepID=A0A327YU51_9ACTN|nr:serine/threonine-protein kinase [Actinoplanes lutulentus]MBB2947133.1 serine/threonine protein kinase [Actinoplanes lutulentus]RAK24661.1 serine/threonine protein kinase [Actinoplanes lutulentus]